MIKLSYVILCDGHCVPKEGDMEREEPISIPP